MHFAWLIGSAFVLLKSTRLDDSTRVIGREDLLGTVMQ
jgi:hypothetical protein